MNPNVYRWCAVPQCKNTSIKTPDKLFINVPRNRKDRYKWFNLARRDPTDISSSSVIYFCEDHFNLSNDMENYIQYRVMGSVSQVRMKSGCIPTKFECQPDRRKRTATTTSERPYIVKKQRTMLIEESEKHLQEQNMPPTQLDTAGPSSQCSGLQTVEKRSVTYPKSADKSVQVHITHKFRSKAVHTEYKSVSQSTSPMKPNLCSVSTSPFKITTHSMNKPGTSSLLKVPKRIFPTDDQSDSDISYTSMNRQETSSSLQSSDIKSNSDCSDIKEETKKEESLNILKYSVLKIVKNPRYYIGLPKNCYYLVELIEEQTKIPSNHILLCFKKIRLNSPFKELADDFAMTTTYASKIFFKNIPVIASVMRPFIVTLNKELIKRSLPMAFRHKFHQTSCIIDCLEIEVQKPSKSLNQALTWSEYKKCNTIKYLVSCTPNGLVNYVSPGYGGQITDTCLVESCDFIKCLQPGMCVMADRGFKHIEQYLRREKLQLVRPPSVNTGAKLSKSEVKETKQIASLRIHIERVIRRLREFNMLKPHSCLNTNFVKILDDVITIPCALINLQDSLIK